MTEVEDQTDALVAQLAAPILAAHKHTKKFSSRCRNAWKTMNRPDKIEKIEKGSSFLLSFFERCQPKKLMKSTETI
jgi:hypothetical protein